MLGAQLVTESADASVRCFAIVVFAVRDMVGGTENDVIMRMLAVRVSGNNIRMMAAQKTVGKVDSDGVCFFIGNLAGRKGLYQMVGLCFSGILCFGKLELEVKADGFRAARKRRNEDFAIGLCRITDVLY